MKCSMDFRKAICPLRKLRKSTSIAKRREGVSGDRYGRKRTGRQRLDQDPGACLTNTTYTPSAVVDPLPPPHKTSAAAVDSEHCCWDHCSRSSVELLGAVQKQGREDWRSGDTTSVRKALINPT